MNKTVMTFVYYLANLSGDSKALIYAQKLREHLSEDSTLHYLNLDKSKIESLSKQLFMRGEFGYITNMLLTRVYDENVTNFEEATEAIVRINDIFGDVFKIHSTAGFLNTIRVERQAVIDTLAEKSFIISLLLQGGSLIEIAMLGGHTSLSSQDYYQGNSSFYADSEMIDFVSSKMHRRSISTKALKDIIFNKEKSEEAPRNLEQCIQTEDGVGYCTIDIDNDILACGDEEFCIGCKHWWCSKVQEYLENNIASSINVKI